MGQEKIPSRSLLPPARMCPKVLRHLDVERNDLVELREVAAAVRNVRVDEAIIRDAKKHACPTLRPTSSGRRRLAGVSSGGATAGGRREAGRGLSGGEMTEVWGDELEEVLSFSGAKIRGRRRLRALSLCSWLVRFVVYFPSVSAALAWLCKQWGHRCTHSTRRCLCNADEYMKKCRFLMLAVLVLQNPSFSRIRKYFVSKPKVGYSSCGIIQ